MPTYDYVCQNCDHAFEEFQSITAKPLKKCPACGKNKLKRLIGIGAGIIFKGEGFYETDYRSEDYKKAAKADSESTTQSSDSSSDSKTSSADAKTDASSTKSKAASASTSTSSKSTDSKSTGSAGKAGKSKSTSKASAGASSGS